jgi:vanillate O-demethylase ferredoxin subunit
VLEENRIEVFKSCEEGICGSCVSGVLEGIPDHRDHCLSAATKASNKEIALCVSRALTDRLVVELY